MLAFTFNCCCEYEHESFYRFVIFINPDSKKQL